MRDRVDMNVINAYYCYTSDLYKMISYKILTTTPYSCMFLINLSSLLPKLLFFWAICITHQFNWLIFLLLYGIHDRNLMYFVFFIEIYQIWPENFEEIIVISNIKTVIPPDKQYEWVKRAKYQKTAHRPFLVIPKLCKT